MAHVIEAAKSGRASCRTCKQPIPKGELRFGEEVPNAFSTDGTPSLRWHHLGCAAEKKPLFLRAALETFAGEVPGRAELDRAIAEHAARQKPATFPYAERAPTGRSSCQACRSPIEKGALRVAVEREVDTGAFQAKSAGYLHARCAKAHVGDPELLEKVRKNSPALGEADVTALALELGS